MKRQCWKCAIVRRSWPFTLPPKWWVVYKSRWGDSGFKLICGYCAITDPDVRRIKQLEWALRTRNAASQAWHSERGL